MLTLIFRRDVNSRESVFILFTQPKAEADYSAAALFLISLHHFPPAMKRHIKKAANSLPNIAPSRKITKPFISSHLSVVPGVRGLPHDIRRSHL
jgi:hypothetical protein